MKLEQLSINLFSLREHLKTPEDFRASIEKLSKIGYRSVQLSGVAADLMPESEFVKVCAGNGITITATHEPADKVMTDPHWSINRLKKLGVKLTAYPYPWNTDLGDAAQVEQWLPQLENARKLYAEEGITLTYHNHSMEFTKVNGKLVYELIFERTQMGLEVDTYWVQMGGCSPLAWVQRAAQAGRLPMIHLKDMKIMPKGEVRFAEIGAGNIDFDPIIAAAEAGGCQSFIVEQDNTFGRDAFESVAESFNYLKNRYVK